ncbi:MAG: exodeoxyribonuclease VII large subunit [Lachnospiraceae bacterium]|nr:exodeoxyribonuclease VII large subunit [Lachnospiraceae bacterium]
MANVYSVTQVNNYIKNMFTQDFLLQRLSIQGEVGNCKYHSSGHIYFTLKEKGAALNCVMFAAYRKGLDFTLAEGQQVIATGSVEVYERDGKYQLYARSVRLAGSGRLYEQYEALKKELEEMGMFDRCYKQPIPRFIRTLGVVTAATGAAVRDIIQITHRRNPYVQILLYPAQVQGEGAAESIVNGIHALEAKGVDVMIVGRGGGSIEDLWAFNERIVAEAVFHCTVPVISAVGHETDTTIIDFVSDLRAPTPSAAAELAVYDVRTYLASLESMEAQLTGQMNTKLSSSYERLKYMEKVLAARHPGARLREQRNQLAHLQDRLDLRMEKKLTDLQNQLTDIQDRLPDLMMRKLTGYRNRLNVQTAVLKGVSPYQKLKSGLGYVTDEEGYALRSAAEISDGQKIGIWFQDGRVSARVLGKDMEGVRKESEYENGGECHGKF